MIKYQRTGNFGPKIWRVFIAGSSQAGKTHFTYEILKRNFFEFSKMFYFHPDIAMGSENILLCGKNFT